MNEQLDKIYYDLKNSGSFSGVNNLYREAKKQKISVTVKDIKNYLSH